MQAETAPLLERSASQKARQWTIATPLLLAAGALAGTSAGCLATLSGIGGPPLILMYELLAVPKVFPVPHEAKDTAAMHGLSPLSSTSMPLACGLPITSTVLLWCSRHVALVIQHLRA